MRKNSPVFIVGSPRSGTTLLYHMLLSSGDFAVYMAEARVFDMLAPHFGNLAERRNLQRLLDAWLPSEHFRRTALAPEECVPQILEHCRSAGDFLRLFMESVARKQGVRRWAECTPTNSLYLPQIKREIPDALIVQIIRDGRDVALSLEQQSWIHRLPWDRHRSLLACGAYWEWLVQRARRDARAMPQDYFEVRFEDLNAEPEKTLHRLGAFIEHPLDYQKILDRGIGTVRRPNTSFQAGQNAAFNPVGRWKDKYSLEELGSFESAFGATLQSAGYSLEHAAAAPAYDFSRLRRQYQAWYDLKFWLKSKSPVGRMFTDVELLKDFHAHSRKQDTTAAK